MTWKNKYPTVTQVRSGIKKVNIDLEVLPVPPVVGLGRKGVVGVVGVPGGVWLGVEGVDVTVAGVPTED